MHIIPSLGSNAHSIRAASKNKEDKSMKGEITVDLVNLERPVL